MQPSEQAIVDYCRHMGLEAPSSGEAGGYVMYFDDAIKMTLTPDGRNRVLCESTLAPLENGNDRQAALTRLLGVNLALMAEQRACLSLEDAGDTPFLFEQVDVEPGKQEKFNDQIDDFVNQIERFKSKLAQYSIKLEKESYFVGKPWAMFDEKGKVQNTH